MNYKTVKSFEDRLNESSEIIEKYPDICFSTNHRKINK